MTLADLITKAKEFLASLPVIKGLLSDTKAMIYFAILVALLVVVGQIEISNGLQLGAVGLLCGVCLIGAAISAWRDHGLKAAPAYDVVTNRKQSDKTDPSTGEKKAPPEAPGASTGDAPPGSTPGG